MLMNDHDNENYIRFDRSDKNMFYVVCIFQDQLMLSASLEDRGPS